MNPYHTRPGIETSNEKILLNVISRKGVLQEVVERESNENPMENLGLDSSR
jgi:hypothetical protein